ncbi:hypothetical protein MHU86_11212 [Fragilaria crotonensis]|nr:hypothetical protein MHU86_11212 [Fragilaria crotonensis]
MICLCVGWLQYLNKYADETEKPNDATENRGVSHAQSLLDAGTTAPSVPVLRPHASLIGSTELFYLLPLQDINHKVKGILVFFHGCNHGGQDFFYLPEDRLVAQAALDRGLAVLSITSADRGSGCWSRKRDSKDLSTVFTTWIQTVQLSEDLPRIGMGASSGGAFLFAAYKVLKFKAMASYIMTASFSREDTSDRELTELGVSNRAWSVDPHPLTPQLCAERIPELGKDRCTRFLDAAAQRDGGGDDENALLGSDYTVLESFNSGKWNTHFSRAQLDSADMMQKDHKKQLGEISEHLAFDNHSWLWASMVEEIAASYGVHEMTAEYRDEVLDWLMEQSGISLK